jgi:SAM-dependent methyltransferase
VSDLPRCRVACRRHEPARRAALGRDGPPPARHHLQGWLDSQLIFGEAFQARVSGSPGENWLQGLMRRGGVPKGGRWASLGCGAAGQELLAARLGLCDSLVGYDASPASLELARRAAEEEGRHQLSFAAIDLDAPTLPAAAFDVVLMNMALHHVRELPAALRAVCRRSLRAAPDPQRVRRSAPVPVPRSAGRDRARPARRAAGGAARGHGQRHPEALLCRLAGRALERDRPFGSDPIRLHPARSRTPLRDHGPRRLRRHDPQPAAREHHSQLRCRG